MVEDKEIWGSQQEREQLRDIERPRGYTAGGRWLLEYFKQQYNTLYRPNEGKKGGRGQNRAARAKRRNGSRTPVLDVAASLEIQDGS
jgi:hypothetical protein